MSTWTKSSWRNRPRVQMPGQEWRLVLCAAATWAVFNAAYVTYLSFGPLVLEGLGHPAIAAAGIIIALRSADA